MEDIKPTKEELQTIKENRNKPALILKLQNEYASLDYQLKNLKKLKDNYELQQNQIRYELHRIGAPLPNFVLN